MIINRLIIFTAFFYVSVIAYSQPVLPIKTPDVTAFMSTNFLPVNEYSGKADVTIPIYTIKFGDLEIPISVSYNTGGVNINSHASRVGLNWTLNAGGMVSKETVGYQDAYWSRYYHSEEGAFIYNKFGYLCEKFDYSMSYTSGAPVTTIIPNSTRDMQPDRFYVAAPGITTKFVHKTNGQPMELTNTGSKITSPYDAPAPLNPDQQIYFILKSTKGFIYTFDRPEVSYVLPEIRGSGSSGLPLTDGLVDEPWPTTLSTLELGSRISSLSTGSWRWKNYSNEMYPQIHLSSIKDPILNKYVNFTYQENTLVDNFRRIERTFNTSNCTIEVINQTNYEHDYSIERVLDKITFPEGTVNFIYENSRLDLRGGKILKKIEVRNNNSELIKGVLFEQDYFATNGCTDQQCYRLKLNAINFYDNQNNILPGYSFEYNSTPLPKRYSLNQDFLGFYNGNHGINQKDYLPKIYYKTNQQKKTFLPFPLPEEGYQFNCGNASLTPILNYTKAGSLEKITYPTGGYSIFEYQLNSFKFLGHEIQGGGLRILSQSLYENNTLRKKFLYNYNNEDGTTSGQINNLPNFVNYVLLPGYFSLISLSRYQNTNNRLEITGSSNIGYSRFRIDEQNNGYIVNNYTNISEYPNLYPSNFIFPIDPASLSSTFTANLNTIVNEGTAPNIYQNMNEKRGKLKSSFIFDKDNNLLKSVTYNYSNFLYDIIEEKEPVICGPEPYNNYVFHDNPHVIYKTDLASENFFIINSIIDEKVSGYNGYVRKENNFLYNANKPFLIEKQTSVNNADMIKEKIFYPHDPEVSSLPNMSTLNDRNILLPIKTMKYKNNKLLFTNLTSYSTFNGNYLFPNLVSDAISNNQLEPKYIFTQYDNLGNILEQQKANDVKEVYLWGYNSIHLVAKIIGTTYDIAKTYITQNFLDAPANDAALRIHLNNLRSIPGTLVTTYTYKPLVGITSQTDLNNKTIYYEYDAFNRLILIRDHDNNILKKFCYNYAGQPENCNTPCTNFTPNWQNTQTPLRCQQGSCGNTGYQQQEQVDINPCNSGQTQWIEVGQNTTACPLQTCVSLTSTNIIGTADFTASYYNTASNITYSFTVPATTGLQPLGTIPSGNYNLTISRAGTNIYGTYYSGCKFQTITGSTPVVFYNITVSASGCKSIKLDLGN